MEHIKNLYKDLKKQQEEKNSRLKVLSVELADYFELQNLDIEDAYYEIMGKFEDCKSEVIKSVLYDLACYTKSTKELIFEVQQNAKKEHEVKVKEFTELRGELYSINSSIDGIETLIRKDKVDNYAALEHYREFGEMPDADIELDEFVNYNTEDALRDLGSR
jgi:hypothetical protein